MTSRWLIGLVVCLASAPVAAQIDPVCPSFPPTTLERGSTPGVSSLHHLGLDVRIDPQARSVAGHARLDLLLEELFPDSLTLFAPNAEIDSVFVAAGGDVDRAVDFAVSEGDSLVLHLREFWDSQLEANDRLRVTVSYRTTAAFQFDEGVAWTIDPVRSGGWFPSTGRKGDRFPADVTVTVPGDWTVATAGMPMAQRRAEDGWLTHVFSGSHELSASSILLAAGAFDMETEFVTIGGRRVGVVRLVRTGRSHAPSVHTGEMLVHFSEWTEYDFPFERLVQVVLPTSEPAAGAGTVFFPERVGTPPATDELDLFDKAFHLAGQWLGPIVSTGEWHDVWLEEALKTYLALAYLERSMGFEVEERVMLRLADAYFREASVYRRPLSWRGWVHPAQLRDQHARAGGAWLLHTLSRRIGYEELRESIALFLRWNQFGHAGPAEFLRAVEAVTDEDHSSLVRQWALQSGRPELAVSYGPDGDRLRLNVRQVQEGDRFSLALTVEVHTLGESRRFALDVADREHDFHLPVSDTPRFVVVDPDADYLLQAAVEQPASSWVAQLRFAVTPRGRLQAARALARHVDDPAILIGLRTAFEEENDAGVRAAIVRTMGAIPPGDAVERALAAAYLDTAPSVRREAIASLTSYRESTQAPALALRAAESDPHYMVQAEAVRVLADMRASTALNVARAALITPSYDDVIRAAGLYALARVAEEAPGVAVEAATGYSEPGQTPRVRREAAHLLAVVSATNRTAATRLREMRTSADPLMRRAAAIELAHLEAWDALEEQLALEPLASLRYEVQALLACQ